MELGGGRVKKERENRVAMKMVRENMHFAVHACSQVTSFPDKYMIACIT